MEEAAIEAEGGGRGRKPRGRGEPGGVKLYPRREGRVIRASLTWGPPFLASGRSANARGRKERGALVQKLPSR